MSACYIVGAGDFHAARFTPEPDDFIIAADAGLRRLQDLGVRPHLTVGDFDSLGAVPNEGEVEVCPVEKDDTDMLVAVRRALERGYRRLMLLGGTGGARFDHTLANIQTLLFAARRGAEAYLLADSTMTVLENGMLRFRGYEGGFSLFCLGDRAGGVYERGSKYLLDNATLTCDFPLGVSNEFAAETTEIEVRNGSALVFWQENANKPLPERL